MTIDLLLNKFFQAYASRIVAQTKQAHNSKHGAFETLQVPVLVDDLVDDSGLEHLLYLVSEQEHQVVQLRNLAVVFNVLGAVLRDQLLEQQVHKRFEVLVCGHLQVLLGKLDSQLHSVR